jgi:hypothetical protein
MIWYKNEFIINLNKLKDNLLLFKNESDIWNKINGTNNSPANLALHICGNLKFNIGAVIGKNGYERERDTEFTKSNLKRDDVIAEVDSTIKMIEPVLDRLQPEEIHLPFPGNIHEEGQTIGTVLVKIAIHLGYHLGQINYHRRIFYLSK